MRFNSKPVRSGGRSDGDDRRDKLLHAARRAFSDNGFDGATTREIAAAAGSNVAAIKYYFGDKAGLFARVIEQTIAEVIEGGAHPVVDPTLDPRESLKRWITWVLRTGRRRQRASGVTPRLMMQALGIRGATARKLAAHLGAPVRQNILALIDQLFDHKLDPAVREHAFVFVFSLCSHFAHGGPVLENMGIAVPEDDAALDILAERLTNFVIGGLHVMADLEGRPKGSR